MTIETAREILADHGEMTGVEKAMAVAIEHQAAEIEILRRRVDALATWPEHLRTFEGRLDAQTMALHALILQMAGGGQTQ